MGIRSCSTGSGSDPGCIQVAPAAMDGSATDARSFRLSWQSLLAVLQRPGDGGENIFATCSEDKNCAESAVASSANHSFGTTALKSGAKATSGSAFSHPAHRFNQLAPLVGSNRREEVRALPIDRSAFDGHSHPKFIQPATQFAARSAKESDTQIGGRRIADSTDGSTATSLVAPSVVSSAGMSPAAPSLMPPSIDAAHFFPAKPSSDHSLEKSQTQVYNAARAMGDVTPVGALSGRTTVASGVRPEEQRSPVSTSSGAQILAQGSRAETIHGDPIKSSAPEINVRAPAVEGKMETRESQSHNAATPEADSSTPNEESRQSQYTLPIGTSSLDAPADDLPSRSSLAVDRSAHVQAMARLRAGISAEKSMPRVDPPGSGDVPVAALRDDQAFHSSVAGYPLPSNTQSATAATPSPIRVAASVHEQFAALDSTSLATPVTWNSAAVHRAEAGFRDPSLGWVTVRAQTDAGGIHASLVPATAEAGQVLGGHLVDLNAYMADRLPHVGSVTVSSPDDSTGQSMMHSNAQQNGSSEGQQQRYQAGENGSGLQSVAVSSTNAPLADESSVATPIITEQHVSVLVE